jgi:hypothetical protein
MKKRVRGKKERKKEKKGENVNLSYLAIRS